MINKILLIVLLLLSFIVYTIFIKKEVILTTEEIQENVAPKAEETIKSKPENSKIELKYYNLSLENNYKELYKNNNEHSFKQDAPQLNQENQPKQNDLDIRLKPEINFDKTTKEMSLDTVQIQMEKKF